MASSQDIFGSKQSTGKKLAIISQYLAMYQKAMKSSGYFRTYYVDAFAGTGEIQLADKIEDDAYWFGEIAETAVEDANKFIDGSTEIALGISPAFDGYLFVEKNKTKFLELKERFKSHPEAPKIDFKCGDANDHVIQFCKNMQKGDRAVIFLDPYGSQVRWETLVAIAETKAVDVWYLFPAGLSVFRQISNKATVHRTHSPSLDRIFGTPDWRTAFIKPKSNPTLFDNDATINVKTVTPESAADFMKDRLNTVFEGGVAEFKIGLGQHAYPSYYLLFAWANPAGAAKKLANKLATAAITAMENKDGRPFKH